MIHAWISPSVILGAVGILVSSGAGIVTWLNYRMLKSADRPIVKATITPTNEIKNAFMIRLAIENQSSSTWDDLTFEIIRPRRVLVAPEWRLSTKKMRSPCAYDTLDEAFEGEKRSGPLSLQATVASANAEPAYIFDRRVGAADTVHRSFVIDSSRLSAGVISMRLILISNDAKRRKVTVAIKRRIPAKIMTEQS